MDDHITLNYDTISTKQQRDLMELMGSSLLNGFTEEDYIDVLRVLQRVVVRLEKAGKEES